MNWIENFQNLPFRLTISMEIIIFQDFNNSLIQLPIHVKLNDLKLFLARIVYSIRGNDCPWHASRFGETKEGVVFFWRTWNTWYESLSETPLRRKQFSDAIKRNVKHFLPWFHRIFVFFFFFFFFQKIHSMKWDLAVSFDAGCFNRTVNWEDRMGVRLSRLDFMVLRLFELLLVPGIFISRCIRGVRREVLWNCNRSSLINSLAEFVREYG